jgi:hypothetical protein
MRTIAVSQPWRRLNVLRLQLASVSGKVEGFSLVRVGWLIFMLALGIRLGLIFAFKTYLNPFNAEVTKVAKSLATTGVFGNAYAIPTGPTAHVAPMYPVIVSLVYLILGTSIKGGIAHQILNSIFSASHYSLLPAVAVECQLKKNIGCMAGLFGALIPIHFLNEIGGGEASCAALALIGLSLLTLRYWRRSDLSFRAAIIQGLCWGSALLLAPAFIPILGGILLAPFFLFSERKKLTKYTLTIVCVAGAVLLPWTIRNYLQLGALVFVRDNFGLEFSISNNVLARATIDENEKSGAYHEHPYTSSSEAMKVKELGEIPYNREKLHKAVGWISLNPVKFLRLTGLRFLYFWFPKTTRLLQSVILWIITIGGIVGLRRMFQIDHFAASLFTIIWLTFPLIYYFVQSSVRYRFPIYWTFLLLGSVGMYSLFNHSVVQYHERIGIKS